MASCGGSKIIKGARQVKPLLSLDKRDARSRVLNLYKAWYRQLPYVGKENSSHIFLLTLLNEISSLAYLTSECELRIYQPYNFSVLYITVNDYDIPKTLTECRAKLREEFDKHRHVQDIRVVDMLVIKVIYYFLKNYGTGSRI